MKKHKGLNASKILNTLDMVVSLELTDFPVINSPSMYTCGIRMSVYGDGKKWYIVIEQLGVTPSGIGHDGIMSCLFTYGNYRDEMGHLQISSLTYDGIEGPVFFSNNHGEGDGLRPSARTIRIRKELVPIPVGRSIYKRSGVVVNPGKPIEKQMFIRAIVPIYHHLLFESNESLKSKFGISLPCLLRLNEWEHPDILAGELPSHSSTFQMISEVLANFDTGAFVPSKPNDLLEVMAE